jgi:uncharacterized membrane protein YciS (DUF1049 family)
VIESRRRKQGNEEPLMEKEKPQNFANHARFVPAFHFFVLPVLLINFGRSVYVLRFGIRFHSVFGVLFALALLMGALLARVFALSVQDRVIRLEMRLRLAELLPMDLKGQINEFTVAQLVGLRFASNEELPELARRVLQDRITDRTAIKKMVKNWRPDYLRA